MDSLFSRLYKYKESDKGNSKENYLTEILAFTLKSNLEFREKFLKKVGCTEVIHEEPLIETQFRDGEYGVPDIVVEINSDAVIVIEVKLDSPEGKGQLTRYSRIVQSSKRDIKYLVYLTKHADDPTLNVDGFQFVHLRWYSIYQMLQDSDDNLSNEFKQYLIEENMTRRIELVEGQKTAIKDYLDFWRSVRDFLEDLKDDLRQHGIKEISDSMRHDKGDIGISINEWPLPIWIGFYQGDHSEVKLGVSADNISLDKEGFDALQERFNRAHFNSYETNSKGKKYRTFYTQHDFSAFIRNEKFDDKEARNVLVKEILALNYELKQK